MRNRRSVIPCDVFVLLSFSFVCERFAGALTVRAGQFRMVLTIGVAVPNTAYVGGANQLFLEGNAQVLGRGGRSQRFSPRRSSGIPVQTSQRIMTTLHAKFERPRAKWCYKSLVDRGGYRCNIQNVAICHPLPALCNLPVCRVCVPQRILQVRIRPVLTLESVTVQHENSR